MTLVRTLSRLLLPLLLLWSTGAARADNITLYSSYSIEIGTSRQLTAYVPLSPNTVTFSVNGIPGGNAMVGTVSATGLYTAPATVPAPNAVKVRATSTAYPDKFGDATMTITQVGVHLWSAAPTSVAVGPFTLRLNGSAFTANTMVTFGGVTLSSVVNSPTSITATGTATAAQVGTSVALVVNQTGVGATTSETVKVAVKAATTPPPTTPPPVTVSINPTSATLAPAATQAFSATVSGSTTTSVNWSVNGVGGGNATVGTISSAGLYTAPVAVPSPATVTVRATSTASGSASAAASVTIAGPISPGPGAGTADLAAGRFLEQAGFGPTPAALARVKAIGVNAWLAEQFTMPETAISIPANDNRIVQSQFLNRLAVANDQLRQKVAYALGEIIVISMNKNNYADETAPYLQILSRNAFGNYRTLLGEIAISSQMGKYLDLANSNKPTASGGANENFPRELMQLFSIGLYKLNLDGSNQLDSGGAPIPVYDQATVQQVALAMTGWTYIGSGNNNWENFTGPMVPRDVNHDMRAKSFLGCSLTAGQSTTQDMNAALDCIYKHPNVGPFISLRLIRSMVMSNPSPAYVTRVASVFNNNGSGVRGDLRAVVTAILTDAEARNDSTTPASGRLKDPIYHIISMLRALGGSITATNQSAWNFSLLAQTPLASPSVFNFYSPLFRIPHTTLAGPEFQIYTPTEAVLRGNFIWQILSNPGADFPLDLSRFVALGGNIPGLIDAIDQTLLYGRMSAPMRQSLANAIAAQSDNLSRARTALYLTLLSGQHAVQH